MRKAVLLAAAVLVLAAAGGASAYALTTIFVRPGHCTKVHGTKVCARAVKPRTVNVTVTVAPSPIGQTFSGNGDATLAPLTLPQGVTAQWTAHPDSDGNNQFAVSSSPTDENFIEFDNGDDGATTGSSFIPPGTYTLDVTANAAWSLSF
ncbi:MAG TPA: hypothetical protein VGF72_10795 [Gaiellaceae bacterium]